MATAAGMTAATRMRARPLLAPLVVAALMLASSGPASAGRGGELPEGLIAEIKFQGNQSITVEQLRGKIKSRVGRPLDRATVEDDMRTLLATKWFSDVAPVLDKAPGDGGKFILTFQVVEMPVLKDVRFIGLQEHFSIGHVRLKDIEETTGLKKGARADSIRARMAVAQIQTLYEEKGYEKAEVKLLKGGEPGATEVVIEIFEGPKFKIEGIDFVGNTFVPDDVLKTKIESRRGLFGVLGAKRHKDSLEGDKRAVTKYYQDNGFFDVKVQTNVKHGAGLGQELVTFTISEGAQYKVRKVLFEGNSKIEAAKLGEGLMLKPGMIYNEAVHELDYKKVNTRYWTIGCIDTKIEKDQKITDELGLVDVVYRIEEGEPFLLGQLIIRGNGRTKDKVARREALMAGLLPGEVLDLNRVEIFKKRLAGTGYFVGSNPQGPGQLGKPMEVLVINKRPGDKPFGEDVSSEILSGGDRTRGQSPEPDLQLPGDPAPLPALEIPAAPPNAGPALPAPSLEPPAGPGAQAGPAAPAGPQGMSPFGSGSGLFAPEPNTVPALPAPVIPPTPDPLPPQPSNAQPQPDPRRGLFPSTPNGNMVDVGPDRQEPFPNRSYADIVANVDEAPTGRLLFGVGASSYGGLSGNVVLHESNFDLFAVPRSWSELTSGRAFRGAGQEFRLELSPGTLINRYSVSFREPYLFELPIGLTVTGYQWSRYYTDWSERRSGGRVGLGYQFGPQTYADVAVRVEDVDIHGFKYPAPGALLAAARHSTLATIRPAIRFDNRNNPVSPTQGSYAELAFEQGFGTFTFPKFTAEGRQHFTTGSRPDNSGKRTLTARGFFGVSGRDTPIYERFFAGDFRSMRGFYYRGVGPHVLGVNTGGILTAIGSVEYQFPWTAGDTIQQVFFCDFGTVEADYRFTTIRASVGTGLRVVIPQITGQLPLAFDLAIPVSQAQGDRIKYFSFFIGAFW